MLAIKVVLSIVAFCVLVGNSMQAKRDIGALVRDLTNKKNGMAKDAGEWTWETRRNLQKDFAHGGYAFIVRQFNKEMNTLLAKNEPGRI